MEEDHLAIAIRERVKKYGGRPAMRFKDRSSGLWREVSWRSMGEQILAVARGLIELGTEEGERVGIFSQNRPEWTLTDYGVQFVRAVSVPLYPTHSAMQARYVVDDAGVRLLFVSDQAAYEKARLMMDCSKHLQKIVAYDASIDLKGEERAIHFSSLLETSNRSDLDTEIEARLNRASARDLATIIYTSGTTGTPKGVMLTHSNFLQQIDGVGSLLAVNENDVSLCFLPLSHVLERSWSYYIFDRGAVNCYCDEPRKIMEYMEEAKPTVMVGVPRLYEKIYTSVIGRVKKAPLAKRVLFGWAVAIGKKVAELKRRAQPISCLLRLKNILADLLILKKIRAVFGGRIRFALSGGAQLSRDVEEFFFAAGLNVCQGFGLTETTAPVTLNTPGCFKFGTVGRVVPGCEVRISERGEILVRGKNVMTGYYRRPNETVEAFTDGWFKTGDVGEFDADGFLKVTDRIKDLIITSVGNNIWPQPIETNLSRDPLIEQIVVIGDRRKFLSALIVPAFGTLEEYARANKLDFSSREELINHPLIKSLYEKRIEMQSAHMADYEKIKKLTLLSQEFSLEAGEMTPTMKIKRNVIDGKYASIIEAMYEQ